MATTAVARWYTATRKGNSVLRVYTRKQGSDVVIYDHHAKPRTIRLLSPAQARDQYNIGSVVDALTQGQLDAAFGKMDAAQALSPAESNGHSKPVKDEGAELVSDIGKMAAAKPIAPVHNYANGTKPVAQKPKAVSDAERAHKQFVHDKVASKVAGKDGIDAAERQINHLQAVVNSLEHKRFVLMHYDIHDKKVTADYVLLWRLSFPLSESVRFFTEESVKDPRLADMLQEWKENGATFGLLPQAEDQNEAIRQIARDALAKRLTELHTSLIYRLDSASNKLAEQQKELAEREEKGEVVTEKDGQRVVAYYDNTRRGILRAKAEELNSALECARRFDETDNVADLLAALRAAIRSQAISFDAEMAGKGSKDSGIVL